MLDVTWARTTVAKKTGLASVRIDNANYASQMDKEMNFVCHLLILVLQ
jgi:hypothetical protein